MDSRSSEKNAENNIKLGKNTEQIPKEVAINKAKWPCPFCELSFARKDRLERHYFLHSGLRKYKCQYWGCTKSYTNSSHLNRHMKSHGYERNKKHVYICRYADCLAEFTNLKGIKKHYSHNHQRIYHCKHCTLTYERKFKLRKHLKDVHGIGEYPYQCDKCGNGYFNRYAIIKHLKSHKCKECNVCNKTFEKWTHLVAHRRSCKRKTNHPRKNERYECDLCSKTFFQKSNIREHMKSHLVNGFVYLCHYENCSKFYTANRNLQAHIKSKHKGKKYMCEICKVKLSTNQKLQLHIAAHDDPKKSKNIKKPKIGVVLGIKIEQNTQEKLFNQTPIKAMIEGISTESEFSDNN